MISDFIPDVVKVMAGFIVGWTGHIFASARDSKSRVRKAKDEFLSIVAKQKSILDALDRQGHPHFNPNEDAVYKESVDAMTAATYVVLTFVTDRERERLTTVLSDYRNHREEYTGLTRKGFDETSGVSFVQRAKKRLDGFGECLLK